MGTRIYPPRETEPGPDCLTCTPDPWPSGATPSVIRIIVRGMTDWPGDPPQPNGIPVSAVNSEDAPCYWVGTLYYGDGAYDFKYYSPTSFMGVRRIAPDDRIIFDSEDAMCHIGPFLNNAVHPDYQPVGGSGYALDFPLSIILAVAETYNFMPDPRGLYHIQDSATPDHKIIRLAGQTHPGSALFKVDSGAI